MFHTWSWNRRVLTIFRLFLFHLRPHLRLWPVHARRSLWAGACRHRGRHESPSRARLAPARRLEAVDILFFPARGGLPGLGKTKYPRPKRSHARGPLPPRTDPGVTRTEGTGMPKYVYVM